MKILFVCRGNMFRSQIAKAFYNKLAQDGSIADSCGTWVELESNIGKKLQELSLGTAIEYMKSQGMDISQETIKPITKKLVDESDKVFVMAEKDSWPKYLTANPKIVYWEINNPNPLDSNDSARIGDQIRKLVTQLIS